MGFKFHKDTIGQKITGQTRIREGDPVVMIPNTGAVTIRKVKPNVDLYSYPYASYAAQAELPDTKVYQNFVHSLLQLKGEAGLSYELRSYVLTLLINQDLLADFVGDVDKALESVALQDDEKEILRNIVSSIQAEMERFRPQQVIDDGDHILFFPQSVEAIAPRAWFDAAWPFIEHFRSNLGLYLGEALLYSRVTILGNTDTRPAVSVGQESYLKREDWRTVERIAVANAQDLKQVLDWGVAHDVRFGLGRVTALILRGAGEDEILVQLPH